MIGLSKSQNVACILYQSMLKAPSGADEGTLLLAGKSDRAQRAIHAAIRAARSTPDAVMFGQSAQGRIVVQRVGVEPNGTDADSQMCGGVYKGFLGRTMIFVLRIIIGNDANGNCTLHVDKSVLLHGKQS